MELSFLGIGAQKSATSWLFQCLRSHPSLYVPDEKELHYFSDDALYAKGASWYEGHFAQARGRVCGEISTSYLASREAPERIHAYAPKVKLIALLRDPADRAVSHIRHLVSQGKLRNGISLNEALSERPDIYENGLYGAAVSHYLRYFQREQLYIGDYDSVAAAPEALIRDIFEFLSVPSDFVPPSLHMRYNAAAFRASPAHDRINRAYFALKKIPGWEAARTIAKAVGLSAPRVADAVARSSAGAEKGLFTPTAEELASLSQSYQEDLALLKEETGFGISSWKH